MTNVIDFVKSLNMWQLALGSFIILAIIVCIILLVLPTDEKPPRKHGKRAPRDEEPRPMMVDPQQHMMLDPQQDAQMIMPPAQDQMMPGSRGYLVMFFAPWCGHCKNLEPVWDEFAQQYNGTNGVAIVKVNGDENQELAKIHDVRGFPTIKYCPYGVENAEGVKYEGDRSLNNMLQFLQQISSQQ